MGVELPILHSVHPRYQLPPPQCEHWASLARAAAIKYRISIHFITFHRAAPLLHSVLIALDHISW